MTARVATGAVVALLAMTGGAEAHLARLGPGMPTLACGSSASLTAARLGEVRALPPTPAVSSLTVRDNDDATAELELTSDIAADSTVMIHIGGLPEPTLLVLYPDTELAPGKRYCRLQIPDLAGRGELALRLEAIAPGGGTSPQITRIVPVTIRGRSGTAAIGATIITALALLIGVPILVMIAALNLPGDKRALREPIALLAAELIARSARRRAGVWTALLAGATIALWQAGLAILAVGMAIAALIGARRYVLARAIINAIESGAALAANSAPWHVFVYTKRATHELAVSARALASASAAAVPRSTIVAR
jgi:hypothetical protein